MEFKLASIKYFTKISMFKVNRLFIFAMFCKLMYIFEDYSHRLLYLCIYYFIYYIFLVNSVEFLAKN
jgi:hypothetical protein